MKNKKILLIGVLVLLLSMSFVFAMPQGGMAYYAFEDDFTDSWHSFDGSNTGTTFSTSYPLFNTSGNGSTKSGYFDGADYVDLGSNTLEVNPITVSVWFNTSYTGGSHYMFVLDNVYEIYVAVTTGYLNFAQFDGDFLTLTTGFDVADGDWHNVVTTANGTHNTLYFDGVLVDSGLNGVTSFFGDRQDVIGGRYNHGNLFHGHIDEIKVYNFTLNSTHILNLYNFGNISENITGPPPPASNVSAYFNFNFNMLDQDGSLDANVTSITYNTSEVPLFGSFGDGSNASGYFDGTDVIRVSWDKEELKPFLTQGDYAFSIWLNPTATPTESYSAIIGHSVLGVATSQLRLNQNMTLTTIYNGSTYFNYILPLNNWTHVLLNYNDTSGNVSLYFDGILQVTLPGGVFKNTTSVWELGTDTASTIDRAYTGFMDELHLYNYTLKDQEIINLYHYNSLDNLSFTSTFTVTEPSVLDMFQRNNTNQSLVLISGAVSANATSIEYNYNGTWLLLIDNVTLTSYSVNATVGVGRHNLQVRELVGASVTKIVTVANISVGDVIIIAGQSNAIMRGTEPYYDILSETLPAVVWKVGASSWVIADDPIHAGEAYSSSWTMIADNITAVTGVPLGYISVAQGGTGIGVWLPGQTYYNRMISTTQAALADTKGVDIYWHQGETDAIASMAQSTYAGHLQNVINTSITALGGDTEWFVGQIHKEAAAEAKTLPIINAQLQVIGNNSFAYDGGNHSGFAFGTLHFEDAKNLSTVAIIRYEAILKYKYGIVAANATTSLNLTGLSFTPWYNVSNLFAYNTSYTVSGTNSSIVIRKWFVNNLNVINNTDNLSSSYFSVNDSLKFSITVTNGTLIQVYNITTTSIFPILLINQTYDVDILNITSTNTSFSVDTYLTVDFGVNVSNAVVGNDNIWYVWFQNGVELVKGWGMNVINIFFENSESGTNIISVNATYLPENNETLWSNTMSWNVTVTTPVLIPESISAGGSIVYDSITLECLHNFTGHVWNYHMQVKVNTTTWINVTDYPTRQGNYLFDLTPYPAYDNLSVRCRTYNTNFNYSNWITSSNIDHRVRNQVKLFKKISKPMFVMDLDAFGTLCDMNNSDDYIILKHYIDLNGDGIFEDLKEYAEVDNVKKSYFGVNTYYYVHGEKTINTGCIIKKENSNPWEFSTCRESEDECAIQKSYRVVVAK